MRADLAASYQRAIVEALARRVERALERTGRGGSRSAAASPPTGRCARRLAALGVELYLPPRGALHRQRGDDRGAPRSTSRRCRYPDYLDLDVYATGEGPLR